MLYARIEIEQLHVLVFQKCLETHIQNVNQNVQLILNVQMTELVLETSVLTLVQEFVEHRHPVEQLYINPGVHVIQDIQEIHLDTVQE